MFKDEEYKIKYAHGTWYAEKYLMGKFYEAIQLYYPAHWEKEAVEANFLCLVRIIKGDENFTL